MAQAVIRTLAVEAAKGKPRPQRLFTEMLSTNNGCLTNSRICTWYVMMDPKITPSGQTIVKPTALGHRRKTQTLSC